jgi:hypothetical protein
VVPAGPPKWLPSPPPLTDTTNIYAEVDLEMKAKALAHCEVKGVKPGRRWNEDKGIMAFLRKL